MQLASRRIFDGISFREFHIRHNYHFRKLIERILQDLNTSIPVHHVFGDGELLNYTTQRVTPLTDMARCGVAINVLKVILHLS